MKAAPTALALAFYALWVALTWAFEGRIDTLLRPEAVGDRIAYALGVNLLVGLVGGMLLLRRWVRHGDLPASATGFMASRRTLWSVLAGLALGLATYFGQGAPSLHPLVIVNAYAQVFVVSAAEVVVCWSVVGCAARTSLNAWPPALSMSVAALLSAALFGLYHFGHSAPFNTWPMVGLLSVVGLFTGAFFFISRDVAGTVVFHNFLGTFGVVKALVAAGAVHTLETLQWPLVGTALVSAVVLGAGYRIVVAGPMPSRARHHAADTI